MRPMMYALDRGVGKIVDELKAAGKFDNTIIFFLSDNGGSTTNQSSNLPLKGFKGNKFEGGQRVPFFVVWGDRFKRDQRFTGLTSSLDIFATVWMRWTFRKKDCTSRSTVSPCCRIFPGKKAVIRMKPYSGERWIRGPSAPVRTS